MELYLKLFISIAGFLSVILKLIDSLNSNQRKKDLVTDLELLSRASLLNSLTEDQKSKIKEETGKTIDEFIQYHGSKINWFDSFYALSLFVGFGWWTLDIYKTFERFNPWIILTTIFSFMGLAMLMDSSWMNRSKDSKKKKLLQILIYKGAITAIVILGTTVVSFFVIYLKCGINYWMILLVALFLIFLKMLFDNIEFKK